MIKATQIHIHRAESRHTEYDEMTVVIADLYLYATISDDRQIRLAKRLADEHGAAFVVSEPLKARVKQALGE